MTEIPAIEQYKPSCHHPDRWFDKIVFGYCTMCHRWSPSPSLSAKPTQNALADNKA